MKAVFLTLMIMNLALLLWGFYDAGRDNLVERLAQRVRQMDQQAGAGERLVLLEELDANRRALLDVAPAVVADAGICRFIGPVESDKRAEELLQVLADNDVSAERLTAPSQAGRGTRVYLPPLAGRPEAMTRLYELQNQGLESALIDRGPLQNGISFGVFGEPWRAQKHLLELRERGLEAELQQSAVIHWHWLVLRPGQAARLDEELLLSLMRPGDAFEVLQNPCP